ncbi:MAG: FG-GAP-like repeat-containing protein [Acidobacteriaceae bacterium]
MKRSLLSLTVAAAMVTALPAFTQTDFQYQPYTTPGGAGVSLAAPTGHVYDFNNDGFADVLAPSTQTCSGNTCTEKAPLYLYMNNGSGGLKAPVTLDVTLEDGSVEEIQHQVVVADFNGDQKLDIAALNASGGITILYGNGDGTFQAPVNITLPSAGSLGYASLAEADFDMNSTQDLAAMTYDGKLVMLFNNGKGNFTQQSVTVDTPPSGDETTSLTVGDFTGNGRPDIAWVEQNYTNDSTDYVESALNTAKGVFSAKHEVGSLPGTSYDFTWIRAAALALDGKSDLVAWQTQLVEDCCSDTPVMAYYSNGDGTFTASTVASTSTDDVAVSDINGDGNPDILIASYQGVQVYAGTGNRTFTDGGMYTSLPGGADQLGFGFFNDTNRVGFAAPNATAYAENDPDDFYLVQNDNPQGDCAYPTSAAVTFCQATQSGNTAVVRGTARAETEPVREIQLWANGKELYQVWSDEFNATLDVAPGTVITAKEVEWNGATKSATVTPTSTTTCAAPSSPGVNVCSPTENESVTSPVTFRASGTGASGTVNHLELWIDGTKIGNYTGATMDASVTVAAGSHAAQVVEVDSKGAYVKSAVVHFTVGTGACAAPSSAGVNVCSPTAGEKTASPVTFKAAGTGASGSVNHLELWIDGTKIGNYTGSTMDTQVSEAAGSHTVTVVEVDSKGNYVKSTPVMYTVN